MGLVSTLGNPVPEGAITGHRRPKTVSCCVMLVGLQSVEAMVLSACFRGAPNSLRSISRSVRELKIAASP